MRAVNLLPRDVAKTKTRQVNVPLLTGVITAVIVTFVLAVAFLHESANVAHKQTQLDAARAELALIPPPAPTDSAASTLASEQTQRVSALQTALNGRVAWDRVLREISLVLPNDVSLNALSLQAPAPPVAPVAPVEGSVSAAPAPAPAPSSTDMSMSGNALSHQGVVRLLSRLALVPDFQNVTLGHSANVSPGTHGPVEFSLTAGIRAPGATS
jgi:Tfp pilus assembly protein PilN